MAARISGKQSGKPTAKTGLRQRKEQRGKPPPTGNKRLAEQIRKILGKHYASKYRLR
jgi:hypothetical protein